MSPRCCSRDTRAQAGCGLTKALPSLGTLVAPAGPAAAGHGLSGSPTHTSATPAPNWAHWEHSCPHPENRAPRTGVKATTVGGHEPPGAIPVLRVKQRRGAGMGWGIIPIPCGSIPNPSSAWSSCCVTSGWPLSPQGTPGWHCHLQSPWLVQQRAMGGDLDPSPQDEELRVRGISPQLVGWKLLPPKPGRRFGEHPKG